MTIDYSKLTPILVEAIKEQQKRIDELSDLVEQLVFNEHATHYGDSKQPRASGNTPPVDAGNADQSK